MVLEKDQASSWSWKQNSLCTVDVEKQALVYNPDYFIYKNLMDNIKLQSRRIMSFSYLMDTLCMKNPDGSMVLLCKNLEGPRRAELDIDGKSHWVDLAGHSICVIQIGN
jgi:hypothetical protein